VILTDENGDQVRPGKIGGIRIRCQAPQRRYLDNPEANARVYVDGWVRTGRPGRVAREIAPPATRRLSELVRDALPAGLGRSAASCFTACVTAMTRPSSPGPSASYSRPDHPL
jgi:acyl-CoA synthetase (AMP-forming)/AMP-acid ligase II